MKLKRLLTIAILLSGLVCSIFILVGSLNQKDFNTSASSLAVITAIIAAWTALTITWHQEDSLLPIIEVKFDLESRYSLIQLVIENVGKSAAFNVSIKWESPIMGLNKKEINFPYLKNTKDNQFHVILPNERSSILVDEVSSFFEKYKDTDLNYKGIVKYKT